MGYFQLALAIVFELVGTTYLKVSAGFTKPVPSLISIGAYFACYLCFAKCTEKIKLCVAYATWCAVGIIASALLSMFVFDESISMKGWVGVAFLVCGVVLINREESK